MALMSDEQLLQFLNSNFGLHLKDELKNPTQAVVMKITRAFLEDFDYCMESLTVPSFEATCCLDHPELYEKAIARSQYYATMKYVMNLCGMTDLSISDLTQPKPKRFKRMITLLANFWQFLATKFTTWSQVKEEYDYNVERQKSMEEENTLMKSKINEYYHYLAQHEEAIAQAEERVTQLNAHYEEKFKEKDAILQEYHQLKEKFAEKEVEMREIDVEIATMKEKKTEMKDLIVPSPTNIKTELANMTKKVETLRQRKLELMDRKAERTKGLAMLEARALDIKDMEQFLNVIKEESDSYREKKEATKEYHKKQQEWMRERKQHEKEKEQMHQTLQWLNDQASREVLKSQKKKDTILSSTAEQERALQNVQAMLQQVSEKLCQLKQTHEETALKLDSQEASFSAVTQEIKGTYDYVVGLYNTAVKSLMEEAVEFRHNWNLPQTEDKQ